MTEFKMDPIQPPRELAPSDTREDIPTISRLMGMVGLFLTTIGVATIIANQYGRGFLSVGFGLMDIAIGITFLIIHAFRDRDIEVRRVYGVFAAILLVTALIISFLPGPQGQSGVEKQWFYYFLPWGAFLGMLSLLFFIPFTRHETEEPLASFTKWLLLGVGATLSLGATIAGIFLPDFLAGPGITLALLGLGFLTLYLNHEDTSDGLGYSAVVGLGILGSIALVIAVSRSIVPTVLHEGPSVLKTVYQQYDLWQVLARIITILPGLALAAYGIFGKVEPWLRGVLAVLGLAWAGVFIMASFTAPIVTPPEPYFVPSGLLLGGIGLLFVSVAVGLLSDNIFVVLTRRELTAYFHSPIGYIVLMGMAIASFFGYWFFVESLIFQRAVPEPILQNYWSLTVGAVFGLVFLVPVLTMRAFSEEKRTGTLEVLLTAPVNEAPVVLSKFVAALAFFMLAWVPAGLFLIALRIEGGQPFDFRPMLSYYLAMAATGGAFIAIGLFFSSLTSNQLVSAALTFALTFGTLLLGLFSRAYSSLNPTLQALGAKFAYFNIWIQALDGQLAVADLLIYVSIAVFSLFLTVKVLEARRWN
jgi:ABC-2 type transport system permease protein